MLYIMVYDDYHRGFLTYCLGIAYKLLKTINGTSKKKTSIYNHKKNLRFNLDVPDFNGALYTEHSLRTTVNTE